MSQFFVLDFVCLSLEVYIEFSFPFFFSIYFCSVDDRVVCNVFNGCIQFSSAFVLVVLLLLYLRINAALNVGNFPSSFFSLHIESVLSLGCKVFSIVISFVVLRFIYLGSSLVHFKNGPEYLTRGTA